MKNFMLITTVLPTNIFQLQVLQILRHMQLLVSILAALQIITQNRSNVFVVVVSFNVVSVPVRQRQQQQQQQQHPFCNKHLMNNNCNIFFTDASKTRGMELCNQPRYFQQKQKRIPSLFCRRHLHRPVLFSAVSTSTDSFVTTSQNKINIDTLDNDDETYTKSTPPITLLPLSIEPMILQSSQPIINETECHYLQQFFTTTTNKHKVVEYIDLVRNNDTINHIGYEIFQKVQSIIDNLTMCQYHSTESYYPRFVSYHPISVTAITDNREQHVYTIPKVISNDGVHVDTNNGKHFRHMTVLLYLTNNNYTGATTFPLATKLGKMSTGTSTTGSTSMTSPTQTNKEQQSYTLNPLRFSQHERISRKKQEHDEKIRVIEAAKILIDNNIYHSRLDGIRNDMKQYGQIIENFAEQLFQREIQQQHLQHTTTTSTTNTQQSIDNYELQEQHELLLHEESSTMGIRVQPQAGYICVVLNTLDTGYPDPLSFHAGETLYDESNIISYMTSKDNSGVVSSGVISTTTHQDGMSISSNNNSISNSNKRKELLTFFKEIPLSKFTNRIEFGQQVQQIRQKLLDQYYS